MFKKIKKVMNGKDIYIFGSFGILMIEPGLGNFFGFQSQDNPTNRTSKG